MASNKYFPRFNYSLTHNMVETPLAVNCHVVSTAIKKVRKREQGCKCEIVGCGGAFC